ncbi:hypothetical protein ZWY2020_057121 [Hordeum vulgare]|nr:hypothetical protein ZWY2020_057121 [Hordeum vulgare]
MLEERKALLKENKVNIASNAENVKLLTLNLEFVDANARLIVQAVLYKILQRQKDEFKAADKKDEAAQKEAEAA